MCALKVGPTIPLPQYNITSAAAAAVGNLWICGCLAVRPTGLFLALCKCWVGLSSIVAGFAPFSLLVVSIFVFVLRWSFFPPIGSSFSLSVCWRTYILHICQIHIGTYMCCPRTRKTISHGSSRARKGFLYKGKKLWRETTRGVFGAAAADLAIIVWYGSRQLL